MTLDLTSGSPLKSISLKTTPGGEFSFSRMKRGQLANEFLLESKRQITTRVTIQLVSGESLVILTPGPADDG
jgi:hypothetical protein